MEKQKGAFNVESGDAAKPPPHLEPAPQAFALPVDLESKAKAINLFSFAAPHMRSFHLNWMSFFITFLSAYASAPLGPIIRDSINIQQYTLNIAGVVTTSGTVFARVGMGVVCDKFGPRLSYAFLLFLTSVPIYGMALVRNGAGFIAERIFIGFALAGFVVCQFWASLMFSPNVVGMANAIAGGWGNAGGGVTQIVMPYLTQGIAYHTPQTIAWRWAFFIPASLHILLACALFIFTQDTPLGNYRNLERSGKKNKASPGRELWTACCNYRMWGLAACYAYSFGVELALDNALAPYFESTFNFSTTKAANLAAIFGCLNFIARPLGGVASDLAGRRFGMRGRIAVLYCVMTLGGLFTCLLGVVHNSFAATIVMMISSGWFLEMTCGAVYGVVPFVSRRSTGIVCGLVSAGGAIGGVLNQAIFFLTTPTVGAFYIQRYNSMKWLGVVIIGVAAFGVAPVQFPMWGGLFTGPKEGYTEEDYYYSEYTPAEREKGMHLASSAFAFESRGMRGMRRLAADAMFPVTLKSKNGEGSSHSSAADSTIKV